MKLTELDQEVIDDTRRLLKNLQREFNRPFLWETGGPIRLGAIGKVDTIPNFEDLRAQILLNFNQSDSPKWYVDYLKQGFEFVNEEKLIQLLLESKDIAKRRLLVLTKPNPYYQSSANESPNPVEVDNLKKSYNKTNDLLELVETLQGTIHEAEESLKQPAAEVEPELTPIELKNGNHKLVLMHELGMIEFLKKKYPHLTDTDLGNIIGPLIGETEQHVRRGISGYGTKAKNNPKTKAAFLAVKGQLVEFGIDIGEFNPD